MTKQLRWLHVSDFHFGKSDYEQKLSTRRLIEHITTQRDNGYAPDFVFITGDIANTGKIEEFRLFTEYFLSPLVEILGTDSMDRIFAIPGNHDLSREINEGFSKEKFLKTDADFFYPTEKSNGKRKMLIERFNNFHSDLPLECINPLLNKNGAFSFTRSVKGCEVGIVGLNTAWLCDGEQDRGALTPGLPLAREALENVRGTDVRFVLGHHPIDWINTQHSSPLQAVFGENAVIYLHGHMHTAGFTQNINGSGNFASIQAGAAWQAPEGGKWRNGFVWGEIDISNSSISLQPYNWHFDNQCWTLDGTRFHENYRTNDKWVFDAPNSTPTKRIDYKPRQKTLPLVGWEVKDKDLLSIYDAPLKKDEAIAFFDGATPNWNIALSSSIPRREIVQKLASNFSSSQDSSTVGVLLGAGCEGKTTALLQASYEILRLNPSKKLLLRTNHTRPFAPSDLIETLSEHDNWLIVIDEADQVAKDLLRFIESGFDGCKGKIDFLLASRDSDWSSSLANKLPWEFKSKYKEITLKDLSQIDSEAIVTAWGQYGDQGLGDELATLAAADRADKLRFYAKKEAKGNSDAFFGALLMCRHGGDLLEHAESMLRKLAAIELECGKNLKDVLGYIAAMHSEGFNKLTFAALAEILELTVSKLQSDVIRRLGKEAAATSTSTTVFTRHKYIASAIVEVLETKFNENISTYFINLAVSEVNRSKSEHILDLKFWRFDLSEQLFLSGKKRLATEITESLLAADPTNYHLITKLASYYRRQDGTPSAIDLFRPLNEKPKHRGFYFEWGVCEGIQRNLIENALLAIYSLSDDSEDTSLTVDSTRMYLSGLATCCAQLYTSYADRIFIEAGDATYSLLSILRGTGTNEKQKDLDLEKFLAAVKKKQRALFMGSAAVGIIKSMAIQLLDYKFATEVRNSINVQSMTFTYLSRIISNIERVGISR